MTAKILSIDSGSSFMKAYAGPGHRFEFPSIIRELQPDDLDGRELKISERYYLVGHSAATSMSMAIRTPHIEEGFHGSVNQYVQMCFAMENLNIRGKMDKLVCSLPYADSRKKDLAKKIRARKAFEWAITDQEDKEHYRKVEFDDVVIVPQGVGTMDFHTNQQVEPAKSNVIVTIDIGSCTTDMVTIKVNDGTGRPDFCRDACTTIENANVNWFKDAWINNLTAGTRNIRNDKRYDYYNLMRHAIQKDFSMQLGDRVIDSLPSFEQTKDEFTNFLKPRLIKAAGDLWHEANKIIFTGGGTYLMNFEVFQDNRIVHLDQWANAIGQYDMFEKLMAAQQQDAESEAAA